MTQYEATTWATYFKEWKEVTVALHRQGTDKEILEAMMQTQFVLSLDQDMFKDQLTSKDLFTFKCWRV